MEGLNLKKEFWERETKKITRPTDSKQKKNCRKEKL